MIFIVLVRILLFACAVVPLIIEKLSYIPWLTLTVVFISFILIAPPAPPRSWVEDEVEDDHRLVKDIVGRWMQDDINQQDLEYQIEARLRGETLSPLIKCAGCGSSRDVVANSKGTYMCIWCDNYDD